MTKDNYYISPNKYRELKYFCLQYLSKCSEIKDNSYISAVQNDGQPYGSDLSNPTAYQGERMAQLSKDIELIEQTAKEASDEFYDYILNNVTQGTPWEYLDVPMSRRSFYYLRRKYFYLLAQKK